MKALALIFSLILSLPVEAGMMSGARGPRGSTGATGGTGTSGSAGSAGAIGQTGASGSNGSAGASGKTGATGFSGATGATGASGATGATGVGNVSGPGSSTNRALAAWNGTSGDTIANTSFALDALSGNATLVGYQFRTSGGCYMYSSQVGRQSANSLQFFDNNVAFNFVEDGGFAHTNGFVKIGNSSAGASDKVVRILGASGQTADQLSIETSGGTQVMMVAPSGVTTTKYLVVGVSGSPASTDACSGGQIAWDAGFIYVCTATGAWKRIAISGVGF